MTFPDVIRLEVSGKCNFRCRHCPNGLNPSPRGILQREVYDALMNQFDAHGYTPRVVVLYHGGEPLLNRDLPFFISEFKKRGVEKT